MNTTSTCKNDVFYSFRLQGIMLENDTYITEKNEYFALIGAVGHMNGMVRLARCWVTFDFVKWRVAEGDCLGE